MKIHGWGRYPVVDSNNIQEISKNIWSNEFIPSGNFRSYGDAALNKNHYSNKPFNRLISFDTNSGLLKCESGVLLADIIDIFLPKGWFLSVSPGSSLVTVGGCVASDVHGKNHHIYGCFSECVKSFELLLPNNEIVECSRSKNIDLFHATCGGMGLTGIIINVSFFLKRIKSQWINQITVKTENLKETFDAFELHSSSPYSVAWIDCLANGKNQGKSVLMFGNFLDDGDLEYKRRKNITMPFAMPSLLLNRYSVNIFNKLYYASFKSNEEKKVSVQNFFYPLDSINDWNLIYGQKGFIQFQFILPKKNSFDDLSDILTDISDAGMGSFLAVLKLYGPQNTNWLSFPLEGYSLALDFKIQKNLIPFINKLTSKVVAKGGRVYLAKDALLTKSQFEMSYENVNKFRDLRKELKLDICLNSLLSKRLEL